MSLIFSYFTLWFSNREACKAHIKYLFSLSIFIDMDRDSANSPLKCNASASNFAFVYKNQRMFTSNNVKSHFHRKIQHFKFLLLLLLSYLKYSLCFVHQLYKTLSHVAQQLSLNFVIVKCGMWSYNKYQTKQYFSYAVLKIIIFDKQTVA